MSTRHYFALGAAVLLLGCKSGSGNGVNIVTTPPPPPPPSGTVTVDFDLAGFDKVRLGASFDYSIRQGGIFGVEVTIDRQYADDLDVFVDADTLSVGFRPNADIRATTMEAVITLPDISRVEISGSADGLIAGFDGNMLEIDVSGNAVLEGFNLQYNYVWFANSGSATIDLSGVSAIPGADVQLEGSSKTTVNLMDFANVTGQMSGSSTLYYYGSDINMQVATYNTASITRLGSSR